MGKHVIIDTDPGVDDALALLLALRSPELLVEAITTVNGNVPLEQATENATLLLDLLDPKPRPILARGAAQPLKETLIRAPAHPLPERTLSLVDIITPNEVGARLGPHRAQASLPRRDEIDELLVQCQG